MPSVATSALRGPTVAPVAGDPSRSPAFATPAPTVAASATPRILSVHTSPAVVHDGDTLLWNVRTTPDVIDVVAHVTAYAFRLQKQAVGQYVLTFTIPHGVPGFFHGTYTLDLVARSAAGSEATMKVPVTFQ